MDPTETKSIERTIQHKAAEIDFLSVFGALICNNEFKSGYDQLREGKHNASTYVFESLSAVGNEIGSVMYDNVVNYIDNIAHIDTCKVSSLRSMIKMLGFDYAMFDSMQFLPLELRNLIDLMSIDKRYVSDNKYIKQDMLESLSDSSQFDNQQGILAYTQSAFQIKDELAISAQISGDAQVNTTAFIYDNDSSDYDNTYWAYVENVYYSLMLDFLNLQYNKPLSEMSAFGISSNLVKDNLTDKDGYFIYDGSIPYYEMNDVSAIEELKRQYDVGAFDESKIVDAIDEGTDSLDNYAGAQLKILEAEISRRAKSLTLVPQGDRGKTYEDCSLSTRYSYYRKAKVLEYARFIDNKFYTDVIQAERYRVDPHYQLVKTDGYKNVISSGFDQYGARPIDYSMVAYVAKSLRQITQYIAKLRHQLKLQTRKNYMKGTSNLLRLVIFQFLYDYAMTYHGSDAVNSIVADIKKKLQLDDVQVQEYFDITEYYNLSTATTPYAYNSHYVNDRFFDEMFERSNGKLQLKKDPELFTEEQLSAFYSDIMLLNDLDQKNQLLGIYEFLSAIYDVGANSTYARPNDMKVMSQLTNGMFTKDMIDQLEMLSAAYDKFKWYLLNEKALSAYKEPIDTIKSQKIAAKTFISAWVTSAETSDLSVTYDKYQPIASQLSNDVDRLSLDYESFLKSEYAPYFKKAEYEYCYEDNQSNHYKQYKHDYFIGNPVWSEGKYIQDELQNLMLYTSISSNMQNHVAYDAIDALLNGYGTKIVGYNATKQQIDQLVSNLQPYGYLPLSAEDLTQELDSIGSFIEQKTSMKLQFLNDTLQQLKQQTMELQNQYSQLETSFANCASRCPGIDQGYYYEYVGMKIDQSTHAKVPCGHYLMSDSYTASYKENAAEYDKNSGKYFVKCDDNRQPTLFERRECNIDLTTGSLASRMETLKIALNGKAYYGSNYTGAANVKEAVSSLQKTYSDLVIAVDSIIAQAKDTFGIVIQKTSNDVDLNVISKLFNDLNQITDSNFQSNEQIVTYNKAKAELIKVVTDFDVTLNAYTSFKKDESQINYFTDFTFLDALTPTAMSLISAYVVSKDSKNKEFIQQEIEKLNDQMSQLLQDFVSKTSDLQLYYPGATLENYQYDANLHIEDLIADLSTKLLLDIANRYADAYYNVQLSCNDIDKLYIDFNCALSAYHASPDKNGPLSAVTTASMSALIEGKIDEIDFYNNQSYINDDLLLKTYGGLSDSYDPYYNHKNKTHPSFQVHPFMYNFVEKPTTRVQEISYKFARLFNEDFDKDYIRSAIDKYIGECGQAIDLWKNNAVDYTGYVTRYEASNHYDSFTNEYSEVVDYDGLFYPPALEDLAKHKDKFITSLSSCMTRHDIADMLVKDLNIQKLLEDPLAYMTGTLADAFDSCYPSPSPLEDLASKFKEQFKDKLPSEVKKEQVKAFVNDNLTQKSYFEKYYAHLGLSDADYAHIADQLTAYYSKIISYYEKKDKLSSVIDIYKYAQDSNENIYALCKQYSSESPTFKEKNETLGELWLRRRNHPIAIPAITPVYNTDEDHKFSYTNVTHFISNKYSDDQVSKQLFESDTYNDELSGKCFYDFTMSKDGKYLLLTHDLAYKDGEKSGQRDGLQYAVVSLTFSVEIHDETTDRRYIVFNRLVDERQTHASMPVSAPLSSNNMYICTAATGNKISRVMYWNQTEHKLHMYTANPNASNTQFLDKANVVLKCPPTNGLIACSFFKKNGSTYLDVYTTKQLFDDSSTPMWMRSYGNANVDINNNTEETDEDLFTGDKTSHDILNDQICLQTFIVSEDDLADAADGFDECNVNADMSYVPSYPGLCGEINLSSDMKFNDFVNVQLLGKSKDISSYANSTFVTDQYTDPEKYKLWNGTTMLYNGLYGRVYEDFPSEAYTDNTIRFETNPQMDYRLARSDKGVGPSEDNYTIVQYVKATDYSPAKYEWFIPIDTIGREDKQKQYAYSSKELRSLSLAMYKKSTRNKNFYYLGRLGDIIGKVARYDNELSSANASEAIVFSDNNTTIALAGSTNPLREDKPCSINNHLDNIKNITLDIKTYDNKNCIAIAFEFEDSSKTYAINAGDIQLVLFNKYDLDQFYYYHYLDEKGIIRADKINYIDGLEDVFNDSGWALVYDRKKIKTEQLKHDLQGYYDEWHKDTSGLTSDKVWLKHIDLSRYSYLSDVYILNIDKTKLEYGDNDNKNRILSILTFKQDEDITYADLSACYKFKDLDADFPCTAGQMYSAEVGAVPQYGHTALDSSSTFIMSTEDNDIASHIGKVTIPTTIDVTQDVRVYEDYFNDDNFKQYSISSPEFFHYVHVMNDSSSKMKDLEDYQLSDVASADKVIQKLNEAKVHVHKTEESSTLVKSNAYVIDDYSAQYGDIDLTKLLKLVVNYKRTSDGITLYFNYNNLFCPSYESIDQDNRNVIDHVDGSYLELKQDQTDFLDVNFQFKYFRMGKLYGYRTARVLTYEITNVSDDKPKFIMRQVYKLSDQDRDAAFNDDDVSMLGARLDVGSIDIFSSSKKYEGDDRYLPITLQMKLKYAPSLEFNSIEADILYPNWLFLEKKNDSGKYKYVNTPGYQHLTFTRDNWQIELLFYVDQNAIQKYVNKAYMLSFDDVKVNSSDNVEVETGIGYVRIMRESYFVLGGKTDDNDIMVVLDPHQSTNETLIKIQTPD